VIPVDVRIRRRELIHMYALSRSISLYSRHYVIPVSCLPQQLSPDSMMAASPSRILDSDVIVLTLCTHVSQCERRRSILIVCVSVFLVHVCSSFTYLF